MQPFPLVPGCFLIPGRSHGPAAPLAPVGDACRAAQALPQHLLKIGSLH